MDFTAHIRKDDRKIQTVLEHCEGVVKLAQKYIASLGLVNIAKLESILHDIGKLCVDFNGYVLDENDFSRGDIDHSYAGAKYIVQLAEKSGNKAFLETARFIARTVISHHKLHDWVKEDGGDYYSERINKSDRFDEIQRNVKNLYSDDELLSLLSLAAQEYTTVRSEITRISTFKDKPDIVYFSFYIGLFERLMQSVLIDADRTDTAEFMNGQHMETSYDPEEVWKALKMNMDDKCSMFRNKNDDISKQRMSISDRCARFAEENDKVEVCKLIVPTGGGKTLSSLRFAIEYCVKHKYPTKDRIFYIAPYTSILEQNSDEIKKLMPNEELFLEHHSNAAQELEESEELQEYELRSEKWDVPVISTTLVQFLNSIFSGKSSCVRRFHRLCNSVIIIDEIQSLPIKCVHLFNLAVNFLSQICKCTVVLCSATQPDLKNLKYPIMLDENESMTGDYTEDFKKFKRTEVIPSVVTGGYTYSEASDFCIEKFKEHKNLLVIVNTKKAAIELFNDLCKKNKLTRESERAKVIHLSTNMCPQHRRDKIAHMKSMLKNGERLICVTTQLIEAGVDISFRCVVRSLAGMDNAAQAAGRCNRNGETDCCPVYIINLQNEKVGRLYDIACAQNISIQMINSGNYSDMLSVNTMTDYFRKFYWERSEKENLSYPVKDIVDTTLVNLLSKNKFRTANRKYTYKFSNQAFETAGKLFSVIDNNTLDIIVPYNDEAKDIIARLGGEEQCFDISQMFRKLQKYMVGIYKNTSNSLGQSGALVYNDKYNVCILKDGFYDKNLGVTLEGAEKELLSY